MKRTKWFSGTQKPSRRGLYEWRCTEAHPSMLRWDGTKWMVTSAAEWGPCDLCRWRGLTEKA